LLLARRLRRWRLGLAGTTTAFFVFGLEDIEEELQQLYGEDECK
jgi:hypothetical protein